MTILIIPMVYTRPAFGDPTMYNIMFGPDKCGYTKRTHLIFNYKGFHECADPREYIMSECSKEIPMQLCVCTRFYIVTHSLLLHIYYQIHWYISM